jgi:hypothetical protein
MMELATKAGCSDEFLCGKPGDESQEVFETWGKQVRSKSLVLILKGNDREMKKKVK